MQQEVKFNPNTHKNVLNIVKEKVVSASILAASRFEISSRQSCQNPFDVETFAEHGIESDEVQWKLISVGGP